MKKKETKADRAARKAAWKKANPEAVRIHGETYRKVHREALRVRKSKYRKANRDKVHASSAAYRKTHAEAERARHADYYKRKRETLLARKAGREENGDPAKARARVQKRNAKKLAATIEPFTSAQLEAHIAKLGYRCFYCGKPWSAGRGGHLDHVVPLQPRVCEPRGAHTLANIVPACRPCNSSKGNKPLDVWFTGNVRALLDRLASVCAPLPPII